MDTDFQSPWVPSTRWARWTVTFVHRFGSALNEHVHFHCAIIDGVFAAAPDGEPAVLFREATLSEADIQRVQTRVRQRVLRWVAIQGYLDPDDAKDMAQWENGGGFSLDASVRIAADDRRGLERLLRYCARPAFALERLEQLDAHRLLYRLPKPRPDGRTQLRLSPLEVIQRLAALVPPPRLHRHRYHGILAPNSPLRAAVTALVQPSPSEVLAPAPIPKNPEAANSGAWRAPARYLWAMLLTRLYESMPLTCPNCSADLQIIAFITEGSTVRRILNHIGQPTDPPKVSPARGPPVWWEEGEGQPAARTHAFPSFDPLAQPEPDFQFDQTVSW